ncbi:MAG: hypothetical protein JWP96_421 [Polaromonas sp.]|nr:hypothetical protein [Polaromonas sp.]
MTANRTAPGISPLRENHTAIAPRPVHERSPSAGASATRVCPAHGRIADLSMWLAKSVRAFARTSRPVSAQQLGANAVQVKGVTVIYPSMPIVLPTSAQQTIACDAGTVWITQGDGEDYVLTAGQSLTLAPRDKVIILALFAPAVVRRIVRVPVR